MQRDPRISTVGTSESKVFPLLYRHFRFVSDEKTSRYGWGLDFPLSRSLLQSSRFPWVECSPLRATALKSDVLHFYWKPSWRGTQDTYITTTAALVYCFKILACTDQFNCFHNCIWNGGQLSGLVRVSRTWWSAAMILMFLFIRFPFILFASKLHVLCMCMGSPSGLAKWLICVLQWPCNISLACASWCQTLTM